MYLFMGNTITGLQKMTTWRGSKIKGMINSSYIGKEASHQKNAFSVDCVEG